MFAHELSSGPVSRGKTHTAPSLRLGGRRHRSSHHIVGHRDFSPHPLFHRELVFTVCFETSIKLPSKFGVSHMPSGREGGGGGGKSVPSSCNFQLLNHFSSVASEQLWLHLETAENEQFWPKDFICSRNYSQMCPDCQKGSLCRSISHISSWTKIMWRIKKEKEKKKTDKKKKKEEPQRAWSPGRGHASPL